MMNDLLTGLVELNDQNYQSILTRNGILLVDCEASSCGACKVLGPLFSMVAERHPRHTFAKLDTLADDDLTSTLGIVHVPTLMLYRDGILLFKQAGNFDKSRLEDIIAQAEGLDMDMVRADIESKRSAERPPRADAP